MDLLETNVAHCIFRTFEPFFPRCTGDHGDEEVDVPEYIIALRLINKDSLFFKVLLPEIRNNIYGLVLIDDKYIIDIPATTPELLQVCCRIREEAIQMYV